MSEVTLHEPVPNGAEGVEGDAGYCEMASNLLNDVADHSGAARALNDERRLHRSTGTLRVDQVGNRGARDQTLGAGRAVGAILLAQ